MSVGFYYKFITEIIQILDHVYDYKIHSLKIVLLYQRGYVDSNSKTLSE
jgi:alpha-acetolactate decarboxylase